jgi:DsbC/DsbD-like thiol-disulfide interchange protein
MKRLFFLCTFFLLALAAAAQTNVVKWNYSAKKIADKTYEIHMTATVDKGWHIFSQNAGDGPIATEVTFKPNPLVTRDGKVKEVGKMVKKYEAIFKSNVQYYEKTVDFVQVVKLKGKVKTTVSGTVEYGVCNESRCLPPATSEFKVQVGG